MARPAWVPLLQSALWVVVMTRVMAWVARSRTRPGPATGTRVLERPTSTQGAPPEGLM